MKKHYDFSQGKRGRIVPAAPVKEAAPAKVRITIRLDRDLVEHFGAVADESGGQVGYQTLINNALREHVESRNPQWEATLRRIIREEMRRNPGA